MQRLVVVGSILGFMLVSGMAFSGTPQRSPIQTIEMLHKAFRDADSPAVDALLHGDYRGVSLQGSPNHRHIYVENRARQFLTLLH